MKVSLRDVLSAFALGVLGVASCVGPSGRAHESSWNPGVARGETLSETPKEHQHRLRSVRDRDRRAIAEDIDLLLLNDRPTRLTRWHDR